jgi:hypothetical protein
VFYAQDSDEEDANTSEQYDDVAMDECLSGPIKWWDVPTHTKCIDGEDLISRMTGAIQHLRDVSSVSANVCIFYCITLYFQLDTTVCRLLLMQYQWNTERLLEKFV